jgi:peptidyl-tRNA hydrolase, PTH1 family
MKLFVGLGNPGAKYAMNRHNIGFMALDTIAKQHAFGPWKKKFHSLAADGDIGGDKVLLLKPETFMNDSGRAVQDAARFLKIGIEDIVVFHDELDLAPAKVKVKVGGGNAGHNGLRSITAHLDNDYKRVRLGIGHPGSKDAVTHYVLNDFAKVEAQWLDQLLTAIAGAAPRLAKGDDARFLTDVARLIQADEDLTAPRPRAEKKPALAGAASEPKSDKAASAHPAGERAGKQKTALADNLKKWLAGRKTD